MADPIPTEHEEQRLFVQWFRRTYPSTWIFAIPNGEARSRSVAARLKAEGVSAGVPDLYIPAWRCWVEMKRQKGGTVSKDQERWHAYLEGLGDTVIVAKGFEAAREAITGLPHPSPGGSREIRGAGEGAVPAETPRPISTRARGRRQP